MGYSVQRGEGDEFCVINTLTGQVKSRHKTKREAEESLQSNPEEEHDGTD